MSVAGRAGANKAPERNPDSPQRHRDAEQKLPREELLETMPSEKIDKL
jgi:hypothetical protein